MGGGESGRKPSNVMIGAEQQSMYTLPKVTQRSSDSGERFILSSIPTESGLISLTLRMNCITTLRIQAYLHQAVLVIPSSHMLMTLDDKQGEKFDDCQDSTLGCLRS